MKLPNLVLVMPPQLGLIGGFATGLISLANYVALKLPSVQIELIDLSSIHVDTLETIINSYIIVHNENLIVGITTTTASYQSALSVAKAFKAINPNCKILLGGHHASADAKMILCAHSSLIDFIIVGEGERSLVFLTQNYPNYADVPGLAFLKSGSYHENPPPPLLEQNELDLLPITFRNNGLLGNPGKFNHVTYVSARGCPLKCAFCSVSNQRIRAKSILQIISDVRELVKLGFSKIAIEDNFFAHSALRTRALCTALSDLQSEGYGFSWDCQTRVESLMPEGIIAIMEKAGCEAVYIGVESVNYDQLNYLGKTFHPENYLKLLLNEVIPRLLKSSIDCYINLQFGLPNESNVHDTQTFKILTQIGKMAHNKGRTVTLFPQLHVVYPGTLHFTQGITQGRFPEDVFESFTSWESQHAPVLTWLGEHFAHGTGGIPEGILRQEALRKGSYEIDSENVFRISTVLKRIDRIPGIEVFNYGSYLVEENIPINNSLKEAVL